MNRLCNAKVNPGRFARVFGDRPVLISTYAEIFDSTAFFVEAFGPPEKAGRIRYWNFRHQDGRGGFTIYTHPDSDGNGSFLLCSKGCGAPEFHMWTLDALAAISNGDHAPVFVGAERVMIRAEVF